MRAWRARRSAKVILYLYQMSMRLLSALYTKRNANMHSPTRDTLKLDVVFEVVVVVAVTVGEKVSAGVGEPSRRVAR